MFGGAGDDTIDAGDGNNVVFGDFGRVELDLATMALLVAHTTDPTFGAGDTITTGSGDDIIFGERAATPSMPDVGTTWCSATSAEWS